MTPKERAAMQQALEALEELHYSSGTAKADQLFYSAFAALREALDQPVSQEPFPKPKFVAGNRKEPCGECHLPYGETCDICGASNPVNQKPVSQEPVVTERQFKLAMKQWDDWKSYALELQERLVKYEGGVPMLLNTAPQPVSQEPVAWMHTFGGDVQINNLPAECYGDNWTRTPLYAAPQPVSQEPVAFADKYGNVMKAKEKLISTNVRDNWYDRPLYEKMEFNADLYSVAGKLALGLECLLLDTKDMSVVSKWWDSAHDALEQWRSIKDTAPQPVSQEPVAWHHPQCEGQCIACLIEKAVEDAYGTQGREYMLRRINATPQTVSQEPCKECGAKQAQIDRLMLEYCPDEMTQEQLNEWAKNQKPPAFLRRAGSFSHE